MRGTETAEVEGLWFKWRPSSVCLNTQITIQQQPNSPCLTALPLFILPSLLHTRDSCDIIKWCHNSLLHHFGRKTTVHVQTICWQSSVYLPAFMPINCFNRKYEMLLFCFRTHFRACDIYKGMLICTVSCRKT